MKVLDLLMYDYSVDYLIEILESIINTQSAIEVTTLRIVYDFNISSDLDLWVKTYIDDYGTSPRFGWITPDGKGKKRAKIDLAYLKELKKVEV